MSISFLTLLRKINIVAIGIPILLLIPAIFDGSVFYLVMISLLLTAFLQICVAIAYAAENRKSKFILVYFLGIILFLFLSLNGHLLIWNHFIILPIFLSMYLTFIIHFKKNQA